jgi:hypothetical protein
MEGEDGVIASPARQLRVLFLFVCTLAIGALPAAPAMALKLEVVNPKSLPPGVRSALWVRDCGLVRGERCESYEEGFSEGDGSRLQRALDAGSYDEVWLASGGGNLAEGVAVGEALRRAQATVRVPAGRYCVSACTVAFLGGVFRFIDNTATYQVHAASKFMSRGLDDRQLKDVVRDPRTALAEWSDRLLLGYQVEDFRSRGGREWAQELFMHFHKSLFPLGLLPAGLENRNSSRLRIWADSAPASRYPGSEEHLRDTDTVRREGVVAVQEILMRLERDSMGQAIRELRQMLPELGPRAEPALAILEAMYSSRITDTAQLSYETLLRMGYITRIVDPSRP